MNVVDLSIGKVDGAVQLAVMKVSRIEVVWEQEWETPTQGKHVLKVKTEAMKYNFKRQKKNRTTIQDVSQNFK